MRYRERWIDAAIDRVFGLAGDREPSDRRAGLLAFERVLLFHLSVRFALERFPVERGPAVPSEALAGTFLLCLGLTFVRRLAPLALGIAICAMLVVLEASFPATSNHFFVELWLLVLFLVVGFDGEDEARVLLAATRISIAVLLFYTGVQKALYGTYFHGQYLLVEMAIKPTFAAVLGWTLPADELARVLGQLPDRVGAGPFRTTAPLFLLASNAVWLFEIAIPVLLLAPRTRRLAVVAVGAFVFAIQSGATEIFFGTLLVACVLLFWPRDLLARAQFVFYAWYALLAVVDLVTDWRFV